MYQNQTLSEHICFMWHGIANQHLVIQCQRIGNSSIQEEQVRNCCEKRREKWFVQSVSGNVKCFGPIRLLPKHNRLRGLSEMNSSNAIQNTSPLEAGPSPAASTARTARPGPGRALWPGTARPAPAQRSAERDPAQARPAPAWPTQLLSALWPCSDHKSSSIF